MPPQHLGRGGFFVHRSCLGTPGCYLHAGEQRCQGGLPLGGAPQCAPTHLPVPLHRELRRAPGACQVIEPLAPLLLRTHDEKGHQQVVQLIRVAGLRADLVSDPVDRAGIEAGQVAGLHRQPSGDLHLSAAPLLERCVIQVGERRAVQDLMGEHRRLGGVARDDGDPASFDPGYHLAQSVDIHRLMQAVLQRLPDQGMVGDFHRAGRHVLLAGRQRREHRRHQVIGLHPLDSRRVLAAAPHPQHGQRCVEIPPPAGLEQRRGQDRLPHHLFHRLGGQELRHAVQREAVLRPQRQQDSVIARRRLQLEVERNAESLAECQPERAIHPGAERRVADELHPAGFVKEPLQDDGVHGRQRPERGQPGPQVADDGVGRGLADPAFGLKPAASLRRLPLRDGLAQRRDLLGKLPGAPRGLASPERHRRRRPLRVHYPNRPGFHPADTPGVGAEQEDIPGHALHGPVLVDRADLNLIGFGDDPEVAELGDGPA